MYPSGTKTNNTFIHEVRNIILKDLSKVGGGGGECKTGELGGAGIDVVLLFVPSFGVEFDDCDFLCDNIFQEKNNKKEKKLKIFISFFLF